MLATGAMPDSLIAARFARRGLPGLIAWPSAEPVFDAALLGAHRPPWTPHDDPRLDALAAGFALLLNTGRAARPRPPPRSPPRSRHDQGVARMRVALYARVSTESQQARGTIGSQLAVLRERVGAEGDEVVAEFCDDGHSGARLDRPGLDALRDAAEAGLIERVWCLSPDRLARVYAYQVIVLDELARHGVEGAVHRRPTDR